jgi:hypothetical protein
LKRAPQEELVAAVNANHPDIIQELLNKVAPGQGSNGFVKAHLRDLRFKNKLPYLWQVEEKKVNSRSFLAKTLAGFALLTILVRE